MTSFIISCDYATCAVPEAYREIFRGSEEDVASAAGWEPGALNLAQGFSMKYRTPLIHGDVTRLLIDLGKDGAERWSSYAMKLPEATRLKVVDRHEKPYRQLLVQRIGEDLKRHTAVVHLMIHTNASHEGRITLETPKGELLAENIAAAWRLKLLTDELDVRHFRNSSNNALGNMLCGEFPAQPYAQIRLDVSQSFFLEGRPWKWELVKKWLMETFSKTVAEIEVISAPGSPSSGPS